MKKQDREPESILDLIDEAFDRRSWHGTNLRGSVRGITAAQALWRPAPGRHNIWELVPHTAYWKYAVTRRLTGAKRGSFAQRGSNWFPSPEEPGEAVQYCNESDLPWPRFRQSGSPWGSMRLITRLSEGIMNSVPVSIAWISGGFSSWANRTCK
jgi:hypothetical protein